MRQLCESNNRGGKNSSKTLWNTEIENLVQMSSRPKQRFSIKEQIIVIYCELIFSKANECHFLYLFNTYESNDILKLNSFIYYLSTMCFCTYENFAEYKQIGFNFFYLQWSLHGLQK